MSGSIAAFVTLAISFTRGTSSNTAQERFSLGVEVLSALESGPFVVKLTLRYQGEKPIEIEPLIPPPWLPPEVPLDQFQPPREWTMRKPPFFTEITGSIMVAEGGPSRDRLQPGAIRSRVYYLHHAFARIPAGPARLRIQWPVYAPSRRVSRGGKVEVVAGPLLAKPSTSITVNIPQATPENLRRLKQQLERELAACAHLAKGRKYAITPRHEQAERLAETLRYCPHEALFHLVPKVIALPDSNLALPPLIQHVYDTSSSAQKAHALFVQYLLLPEPEHASSIFSFWDNLRANSPVIWWRVPRLPDLTVAPVRFLLRPRATLLRLDLFVSSCKAYRQILPKAEVQRVQQARNIWVRALTWVTFPRRCDRRWVAILQADLRRLNRPLPVGEFKRLLSQLNSPRFAVRERAAAELLRFGDGVAPALREALKQRLSLELRRRIERLLEDIDGARFDPLRYETLAYLASRDTPEARAALRTLAEGLPQARLTKEAAAALKQGKEYRPRQMTTPREPLAKPELKQPKEKQ